MSENSISGFGPVTDKLFNYILEKCKSDNVKEKFIDSIAETVNKKIEPYVYFGMIMYVLVLIILVLILILLLKRK